MGDPGRMYPDECGLQRKRRVDPTLCGEGWPLKARFGRLIELWARRGSEYNSPNALWMLAVGHGADMAQRTQPLANRA